MADFAAKFRNAIAQVIVANGDAYDANELSWGDDRGMPVRTAPKHMQECSIKSMTHFVENYTWANYDTINSTDYYGVSGNITCVCGEVDDITFIIEEATMGSIMAMLLAD